MNRLFARKSLLWTFSGAFLIVLVGGVILQSLLLAAVLRPAVRSWRTASHEAMAQHVATLLADSLEAGNQDLVGILRGANPDEKGIVIAYRDPTGKITTSRGSTLIPPPSATPPEEGRFRRRGAGAPVFVRGRPAGEVLIQPAVPEGLFGPRAWPRPGLLFLPVAAIIAGAAGFILFRGLARRIARLEESVRRVADGDLETRVADPGRDEIGRLGDSFNAMAAKLHRSREQLLEADRQRRRFLTDVTHDLATPLTTIRGYAETLLDPNVPKSPDERERYVRFIHEEAMRMDALVTDLLDLARVESGGVPLDVERIDLLRLVRGEVERMRPVFAAAGLDLRGPEGDEAVQIDADRRRIEQCLSNLLGNALRYVPAGGWVKVEVAPEGPETARLAVEDDGPGFRPEEIPFLFDRFYRGNPARPSGGTGLGMAIIRGIARAHRGEASAENRPEGGARVVVRLPRTP